MLTVTDSENVKDKVMDEDSMNSKDAYSRNNYTSKGLMNYQVELVK